MFLLSDSQDGSYWQGVVFISDSSTHLWRILIWLMPVKGKMSTWATDPILHGALLYHSSRHLALQTQRRLSEVSNLFWIVEQSGWYQREAIPLSLSLQSADKLSQTLYC